MATRVPDAVVLPHGSNSFALGDGSATLDPDMAKRLSVDVEAVDERGASTIEQEQYPVPTEDEIRTLRKVVDHIPAVAYLICVVELAERASYYGASSVFANFMQFPLPSGGDGAGAPPAGTQETAGALGKGLQFSNAMVLVFMFLAYIIPIFGGWVADTKLGRLETILLGVLICGISHIIMICGAIPSVLEAGQGIAPFVLSLLLLAIGAGIFKPNIAPTLLDQYTHQKPYTKVLPSGEKVVVDPEMTIQRIMLFFYGFVNIGAFFSISLSCPIAHLHGSTGERMSWSAISVAAPSAPAYPSTVFCASDEQTSTDYVHIGTTYSEKYIGFWLAFLTPGIVYFLLPLLLWYLAPRITRYPANGSALTRTFKILGFVIVKGKGMFWKKTFWDNAKPSNLSATNRIVSWTDSNVEDVKRTFVACGVFLYFPIYYINDGGIGSIGSSQASTMTTNGAPNDLLNNFNPLTIIVIIPFLSYVFYPLLQRYNIKFGRISRITFGFLLATISGVVGAIIQWKIYQTSPCGYYATGCTTGTGVSPISVWVQIPVVSLGAISECFSNVTAYELAYARAPPGMKALVLSLFLAANALSSALGLVLTPVIQDPYLIWVWAGPAIALFVQTLIFWFRYKEYNNDEFMMEHDIPGVANLERSADVDVPETIRESDEDGSSKNEKI